MSAGQLLDWQVNKTIWYWIRCIARHASLYYLIVILFVFLETWNKYYSKTSWVHIELVVSIGCRLYRLLSSQSIVLILSLVKFTGDFPNFRWINKILKKFYLSRCFIVVLYNIINNPRNCLVVKLMLLHFFGCVSLVNQQL